MVKKASNAKLLKLRDAKVKGKDRKKWRGFVNGTNGGVNLVCITEITLKLKPKQGRSRLQCSA